MNSETQDFTILTAKNYNRPEGLSSKFFWNEARDFAFRLSGPIGLGLNPTKTGVNVAFGAGTGVLTFMDYVAYIARQALRSTVGEEMSLNKSSMIEGATSDISGRFVFYVSFMNEQQAIGMQLCEALNEFCKVNNMKDFKLHVRFSNKNK